MTNRDAYVFGWVYGRICAEDPSAKKDPSLAAMRPYSGNAQIISWAHQNRLLTGDLDTEIGKALCEIKSIDPPMDGEGECVQPLEIQGSWQFGYFRGLGKNPLPPQKMDIKVMRIAKGLTQTQLAAELGIDQAVISRWERGTANPTEKDLAKLKEILS